MAFGWVRRKRIERKGHLVTDLELGRRGLDKGEYSCVVCGEDSALEGDNMLKFNVLVRKDGIDLVCDDDKENFSDLPVLKGEEVSDGERTMIRQKLHDGDFGPTEEALQK